MFKPLSGIFCWALFWKLPEDFLDSIRRRKEKIKLNTWMYQSFLQSSGNRWWISQYSGSHYPIVFLVCIPDTLYLLFLVRRLTPSIGSGPDDNTRRLNGHNESQWVTMPPSRQSADIKDHTAQTRQPSHQQHIIMGRGQNRGQYCQIIERLGLIMYNVVYVLTFNPNLKKSCILLQLSIVLFLL